MKTKTFVYASLAMAVIVMVSNYLVQFPIEANIFGIEWANILTWGAFSYPLAFVVTDLTNRIYGPQQARKIVWCGFIVGVVCSLILFNRRVAIASGSAFLTAQFLDIYVFNRLKNLNWWLPPFASSTISSTLDTIVFFSISFAAMFNFLNFIDPVLMNETGIPFYQQSAPLFGIFQTFITFNWISWALGDFSIKLIMAVSLLVPYKVILNYLLAKLVMAKHPLKSSALGS